MLALATSSLWGTSDFFGGLASKRLPTERVILWAHFLGLIGVAAFAPFLADSITGRDLLLGVLAGVVGLGGLFLLYSALATGPMTVAAPVSALTAALVPLLWTLRSGADLTLLATLGVVIGLFAVIAISWERSSNGDSPITARLIASTILAGACFGSIVLIYDATAEATAPWPIVSGRIVTTLILFALIAGRKQELGHGGALGLCAAAGIGDTVANVTLLFATSAAATSAELSIVAVIAALYPAATVLWARALLKERFGIVRVIGLGLALTAVSLMTLG